MEAEMAVKLGKPIIMLHHPDTNEPNYVQFSPYVETAPEFLKPYFN